MITIIDYGLGNINAFYNIYKSLNIKTKIARNASDLKKSTHIILPGVGAFDEAMSSLEKYDLRSAIVEKANSKSAKILGICIGMHILGANSEEGNQKGLNLIPGVVKKITNNNLLVPHMGWNTMNKISDNQLLKSITVKDYFYFLHSYIFVPKDNSFTICETDYSSNFTSAIKKDNIYGIQFHPEKSHKCGIKLLKNFSEL
tara:strand:+ start:158 stop:760 length:603 start_codon:yes stop_codon:yes gene_type:complete